MVSIDSSFVYAWKRFKQRMYNSDIENWKDFKLNMDAYIKKVYTDENRKHDIDNAKYLGKNNFSKDDEYIIRYPCGNNTYFNIVKWDTHYTADMDVIPDFMRSFHKTSISLFHTDKQYLVKMMAKQIEYYWDLSMGKEIIIDKNIINMRKNVYG